MRGSPVTDSDAGAHDVSRPVDQSALRACLGRWPTGVAVITTRDVAGTSRGLTVNSFSSVSLDPPLVLWSLARTSQSFTAFANCQAFAVNVLAFEQAALARRFAASGGDKFTGMTVEPGDHGAPRLAGCAAWLECRTTSVHDGGDHLVLIGRVLAFAAEPRHPLVFCEGELRTVGERAGKRPGERPSAAVLVVGNELVREPSSDENARYIARRLGERGIDLREVRMLADDLEAVAGAVQIASRTHDFVFVTGGLGPTHDDVTTQAVARAFRRPACRGWDRRENHSTVPYRRDRARRHPGPNCH